MELQIERTLIDRHKKFVTVDLFALWAAAGFYRYHNTYLKGFGRSILRVYQSTPINSPYFSHMSSRPLLSLALSLQTRLEEFRESGKISLVGHGLNIAAVVAVARLVL